MHSRRPELLKGVYEKGFKKPTKIQSVAIPAIFDPRKLNIIAQAQSGTGKTAAFSRMKVVFNVLIAPVGLLNKIDESQMEPQAVVVSPTRELSAQIESVIKDLGKFTKVTTFLCVPDQTKPSTLGTMQRACNVNNQEDQLKKSHSMLL